MNVADVLALENIIIDLGAPTKSSALQILSAKAAARIGVDEGDIAKALTARERLGSTGIGGGIAVPHASLSTIKGVFVFVARLKKPIDFDAIDDIPVDIVFLLLFPEASRGKYLSVLSGIARAARSEAVLRLIREAESADQLYQALIIRESP